MSEVRWLEEPEEKNYLAAHSYIELLVDTEVADQALDLLREAPVVVKKARDILRASTLPLVPVNDFLVSYDLARIVGGRELSPVLLARGDNLIVADGYHLLCAFYHSNPDADVCCKLI